MRQYSNVVHILAWLSLIALTVWIWDRYAGSSITPTSRSGVVVMRDLVYRCAGDRRPRLDLYLPAIDPARPGEPGPRPVILAIHGGSWIGGARSEYGLQVRRFAEHGYVVAVADYRLARPESPSWPEALDDLREAVRWLRRNSREFHLDPARVVALGASSGGHLATMLGTIPDVKRPEAVSARVQAVVSMYGPTDLLALSAARRRAHDPIEVFLGGPPSTLPEKCRDASPVSYVTADDPPMLLIHGSDDAWVSLDQSLRLVRLLETAAIKHRLMVVDGARHGFELVVEAPRHQDLVPEILTFLGEVWRDETR